MAYLGEKMAHFMFRKRSVSLFSHFNPTFKVPALTKLLNYENMLMFLENFQNIHSLWVPIKFGLNSDFV